MYTVYILQSMKDAKTYVGYSNNVQRRLLEHNSGQSKATRHRRPFEILFTEEFETEQEAKKREMYWKSGAGRRKLKEYFDSTQGKE